MSPLLPTVKWAQRPNVVYLTVDVQDAKDPQIELSNDSDGKHGQLVFKSKTGGDAEYALELQLYAAVDKDKSKITITPRSVFMVLEKENAESWPRLTKESSKHLTHIKVDWDKWVDSDDEGEDNFDPNAMGDMMGMGGMGGMGGMPGMGGMGGMPGGMGGLAQMMGGMGGMGGAGGMGNLAQMMGGMGGMAGMGGMGGMGDMNFEDLGAGDGAGDTAGVDSDDEDLPELEA